MRSFTACLIFAILTLVRSAVLSTGQVNGSGAANVTSLTPADGSLDSTVTNSDGNSTVLFPDSPQSNNDTADENVLYQIATAYGPQWVTGVEFNNAVTNLDHIISQVEYHIDHPATPYLERPMTSSARNVDVNLYGARTRTASPTILLNGLRSIMNEIRQAGRLRSTAVSFYDTRAFDLRAQLTIRFRTYRDLTQNITENSVASAKLRTRITESTINNETDAGLTLSGNDTDLAPLLALEPWSYGVVDLPLDFGSIHMDYYSSDRPRTSFVSATNEAFARLIPSIVHGSQGHPLTPGVFDFVVRGVRVSVVIGQDEVRVAMIQIALQKLQALLRQWRSVKGAVVEVRRIAQTWKALPDALIVVCLQTPLADDLATNSTPMVDSGQATILPGLVTSQATS